jgi:transcriptional regulator with XRE-family HTH domain
VTADSDTIRRWFYKKTAQTFWRHALFSGRKCSASQKVFEENKGCLSKKTFINQLGAEIILNVLYRCRMLVGQQLREIRESKKLSQGDVEKRTGLLSHYTSRVENGHTVPSLATLEKYAAALEVPLYRLFYDGKPPVRKLQFLWNNNDGALWGAGGRERRELRLFAKALLRMNEQDRKLLFAITARLAHRTR